MRIAADGEADEIEEQLPDDLRAQWRELCRIMLRIQQRQYVIDLARMAADEEQREAVAS